MNYRTSDSRRFEAATWLWLAVLFISLSQNVLAVEVSDKDTLRGINRLGVKVVGLSDKASPDELREEELRISVEDQLRKAGIKVLPFKDAVDSEMAVVLVRVNSVQAVDAKGKRQPLCAAAGQVEVKQAVNLVRDPIYVFSATTWARAFNMTVDVKDLKRALIEEVTKLVYQLIEDFEETRSQ